MVGLLGPNGAGKTTTMQMLVGVTELTSGSVHYFGMDFATNRRKCLQRINFTSAYNSLQAKMTVRENLMVFAALYGVKNAKSRIAELAEYFDIAVLFAQRFATLSAGQKTRVNLVKALINNPELVLMDEPTASLDPDIRDKTLSLIKSMIDSHGLSVLFTSHNMNEVSELCEDVIFLDHGKVVMHNTPANLTAQLRRVHVILTIEGDQDAAAGALSAAGLKPEHFAGCRLGMLIEGHDIAGLLAQLHGQHAFRIVDVETERATLDDVFMKVARA